jgi:ADP-ribose pyrophosphatase YjhB (NUDIX family)/ribosomal protein S27AE
MSQGNARDAYRFCPRCAGSLEARLLKPGEPERLVCGECGFIFYLDPKLAAGTISMLDGGLVLLRRGIEPQLGKWVFPGGFVDRGESVAEAAVRETLEEVNLRVSLTGILDIYSFAGHEVVVVAYAAEVVGGSLAPLDECLEARVFAPEAIPWDELAFESTRFALRDYLHRFFPRVRVPRIP